MLGVGAVTTVAGASTWLTLRPETPAATARGRARPVGTAAVLGATRRPRVGAPHGGGVHGHTSEDEPWSSRVDIEVRFHNEADAPVLVSAGQFRLRVGEGGPTVTPYDAGWRVNQLAPAAALTTWISYLAPAGDAALWVEYDDLGTGAAQVFALDPRVLA